MPKIRDRTIVRWLYNGEEFDEEFIFYASDDDEEEETKESIISTSSSEDQPTTIASNDLQHQMIILILNDCVEKFAIMKCIAQKKFTPCSFKFPEYKSIEDRYGDKIEYGKEFYSEGMKRFQDLTTIFSVLLKTLEDLIKRGTFTSLVEGTHILKKLRDEENKLLFNETDSLIRENEMKTKLVTQAKMLEGKYAAKLEEVRLLEVEFENAIGYGKLEERYIDRWEASRRHQGMLTLEKAEGVYTDIINTCEIKTNLENRIHNDIVRYFDESCEDMNNQIEYWMEHYEEEIEARDAELLKLRMDRDAQTEKYNVLKQQYEEHEEFIKYWGDIKEQRRLAEERRIREWAAAVKIQSWWRMIMVFRHLGKYRRRKGKGKDKGKKDKKNAKKKKK